MENSFYLLLNEANYSVLPRHDLSPVKKNSLSIKTFFVLSGLPQIGQQIRQNLSWNALKSFEWIFCLERLHMPGKATPCLERLSFV
jgi:hypothetical protein